MTFEERLSHRAREIDAALASALAPLETDPARVPQRLADAMRYAVMSGGKRLRPFLLLEAAAVFGVQSVTALPAAMAIELVHCYSLVHDDLPAMDNDELRRGKPTVWKAWDDWTAILTGDALLAMAFEQLAATPADVPRGCIVTLMRELGAAAGGAGMVGGQCLDLEADKLGQPRTPDERHVRRLQAMKTGALFRFSCRAGAYLGNATPDELSALTSYGEHLGAAFQLADDILDVEGEATVVGKATGKDAASGKATLVGLMGLSAAKAELLRIEQAAEAALALFADRAGVLRETMHFAIARKS